ncbi:MAG: metal ABC transporter permease [Rhodobacteraceae bacterium]|nr:metal ABC transporter permease [Paracoccaceae bacterium]
MTLDPFLMRAILAGLGVALAAAPLGCFVVWRRMAYFGDATAHAAMLGIALSLALSVPLLAGTLAVALTMALAVSRLSGRGIAVDTLLGVMSHSALAFGIVAIAFVPGVRLDLSAYLFGDILAVRWVDVALIWLGAASVSALVAWRWSALLTATLSPELAQASGIRPERERLILTVALALVVALAIKVVGVLLIAALLIIPAAAARPMARTPEGMAAIATALAAASVLAGIALSFAADTPTGPTIVCAAALVFVLSNSAAALLSRAPPR